MAGTQSIERAIRLLTQVATREKTGWVLADVAAECGLSKATAHRILATLVQCRLLERHPTNAHYLLGPLLFELALGRPVSFKVQQALHEPLARLSRRIKAVCFVSLRSGQETVVAANARSLSTMGVQVDVGLRRPLVLTVGGVAILLALPRAEANRAITANLEHLRISQPRRVPAAMALLERSRRAGFGLGQGDVIKGTVAIGMPLRDADGIPFGAVCIASTEDQLAEGRIPWAAEILRETAAQIEASVDEAQR